MATSGYVNAGISVNIHMASALPVGSAHSVTFSGPLAGPHELEITRGRTLSFDNTNWSTDQVVRVVPKRPGTVNLNYVITTTWTRRTKTGTIPLTVTAPPVDTFIPDGEFIGASDLFGGASSYGSYVGYLVKGSGTPLVLSYATSVQTAGSPSLGSTSGTTTINGAAGSITKFYYAISSTTGILTSAPVMFVTITFGTTTARYEKITFEPANPDWIDSAAHNAPPRNSFSTDPMEFSGATANYISSCISCAGFIPGSSVFSATDDPSVSNFNTASFVSYSGLVIRTKAYYCMAAGATYNHVNNFLSGQGLDLVVTGDFRLDSFFPTTLSKDGHQFGFSMSTHLTFT